MILITGGEGQLAKEFQRFFKKNSMDFLAPNRLELDIADFDKVRDYILNNKIDLVINCAAYNLVDKAEEEKDNAYMINAYAVENIAKAWASIRESIKIAIDQISSPTSTKDIVDITWKILNLRDRDYGIYHISGAGETSRYEQGKYILEKIGYTGKVLKRKCLDFTSYDIRPKYSKLSSRKIENILEIKIPSWRSRIDEYL